jgi:hypothetical protein
METPTGFGTICALYPVLARVQAEIAWNSNAIKIGRHSIQNVETTVIFISRCSAVRKFISGAWIIFHQCFTATRQLD